MEDIVVSFKNVTKQYKLYNNKKDRFMGIFLKNRKYETKLAVNDVSFEIKRGESVAFLGRNGAGKSTILKMITGVVYPTKGRIRINDKVSALLELTSGFEADFTGKENIFLRGYVLGYTRRQILRKAREIIEFADLENYINQPVKTYSSGMKARLGFSIIVHFNPKILVVDEALSVGDNAFRNKCLDKVKEIMSSGDVTLLFVTHSVESAKSFCDRGILIKNGEIVCDANIDEAIEAYKKMG